MVSKLIDWANVKTTQSLQDGYLPIPTVHWQAGELGLATTLMADGTPASSSLLLRYIVHNDGAQPRSLTLALLVRPFQVNPPTQFLNTPGGISPIHDFAWDGHALQVNHDPCSNGARCGYLLRLLPVRAVTTALPNNSPALATATAGQYPARCRRRYAQVCTCCIS